MSADFLEQELAWLGRVVLARVAPYFERAADTAQRPPDHPPVVSPPDPSRTQGVYPELLRRHRPDELERVVLALALVPHLRPSALDVLLTRHPELDRPISEFGGAPLESHMGFWPTLQTAAFVYGGQALAPRLELAQRVLAGASEAPQRARQGPRPEPRPGARPVAEPAPLHALLEFPGADPQAGPSSVMDWPLTLRRDVLHRIVLGDADVDARYGPGFPARPVTTALEWRDLILAPEVMAQLETIAAWVKHRRELLVDWRLQHRIAPGYRALLHGPPGTGKSLSARLLGKATGLPVYQVDLASVLSKYIGETEKNLACVFDEAQAHDWILFFDEGEALFSQRSQGHTVNDRHANQEVAYLLQRIEQHPGVILLATNLETNLDRAFLRRFQSVIHFPLPTGDERLRLWQGAFDNPERLACDVRLDDIARDHEVSGGEIVNVLQRACLAAVRAGRHQVHSEDLASALPSGSRVTRRRW